ncbi:geranylgeranyl reductase family protein [Methermicoccus shengliensis]|uniref:NAD(P)/FAD-dependent oxidoreductase n=1 Tax=Methermicoccus shengliensis TaxID=660064 RepID=A0A832RTM2_9EURY|nr:NAD(P)/FAD-dependent oxidoreductase [Methermicoccus shengliensis]KUK04806.1 MAG: Geranylgeranyl reductase [Euryarchaeota archaeon 55_53]KUK30135.1 MAG: Geranylgeranyl reductase [Methanosarcinales archeaon 56_1174]MDI3487723.1 digeranylgeranylglycerophospholipid reductase [Methanosarcinales archaeon]MDN5295512.1 digeranylgeranylglycerophospholipid reductase [Methanosarcinales archaeon]HIH70273.1 NAD(P)/FAD-dependent oxidoreductase [Methermicoccus shengliensis]
MSERWQIVVVGAGPAGLAAAKMAAEMGASVLVVEEHARVGTPVQCAGFLPQPHELEELLSIPHIEEELSIVSRARVNTTSLQRMVAPDGTSKQFEVDGWVLDRARMDELLAKSAARAGAEVLPAARLERLASGGSGCALTLDVRGVRECVKAQVVIGADGPLSKVASQSGLVRHRSKSDLAFCLYEVRDGVEVEPDVVEMYFGRRFAPGGYGWVIPHSAHRANVGVGSRLIYGSGARSRLHTFVHSSHASPKLGEGVAVARGGGLVPCGMPPKCTCTDAVLIAGDAASHVVSTTGGGIPLALAAGRLAGMCAAEHVLHGRELCEYERLWRQHMLGCIEGAYAIRRTYDVLFSRDVLLSVAMRLLSPIELKSVQQGRVWGVRMRLACALAGIVPPKC